MPDHNGDDNSACFSLGEVHKGDVFGDVCGEYYGDVGRGRLDQASLLMSTDMKESPANKSNLGVLCTIETTLLKINIMLIFNHRSNY